ncbi:DUF6271 family protein [Kitasatospora purpeofusca]|uniref:DUF6271 family protein n=1 Tax=Kitasatospora purpeofusca TaxID=67352 RepID=UPI002A5AEBF3|nr:DUF6271 family protein [Kitasatospora purpeofusca]MDY0816479.1 DUF6271 family protein [Kitasatospora purpeofusca]
MTVDIAAPGICLALPTNRACAPAIADIGAEAAWAAREFGVRVHLLILDSADAATRAGHEKAVADLPAVPGLLVHHLDEEQQRAFLRTVIDQALAATPALASTPALSAAAGADRLLDLMLPDTVSYGACTNRAFLFAAALGCTSLHRRDSDSTYQELDGEPVFPIHHELRSIGRRAADAASGVTHHTLDPAHAGKPVALVGSSFIGELSVDLGEVRALDPAAYEEVVGLWAATGSTAEQRRELVADSFVGNGTDPFTHDRAVLDLPDIWRIDMSNIALDRELYERVPLPPATDTIGSDYFLHHLVLNAGLPGVTHNRNIVNHYTPERRTDAGFLAYQLRFTKFLLSMLYLHPVYAALESAGGALLDEHHHVRPAAVAGFARLAAGEDRAENHRRLAVLDRAYRGLGGRYADFADHLLPRRERLLDEAQADIEAFALLVDAWRPLVAAARTVPPTPSDTGLLAPAPAPTAAATPTSTNTTTPGRPDQPTTGRSAAHA